MTTEEMLARLVQDGAPQVAAAADALAGLGLSPKPPRIVAVGKTEEQPYLRWLVRPSDRYCLLYLNPLDVTFARKRHYERLRTMPGMIRDDEKLRRVIFGLMTADDVGHIIDAARVARAIGS
ncbi:MAG: hypothetical protein ACRDRJ_30460 [Streptosporangiaceae bacterium]